MDHLALYSKNCKSCGYLDPEESTKFTKCHFSKGNTDCPAEQVQLVIVGKARRLAKLATEARVRGDFTAESKVLQEVGKRSAAFQLKFKEWLSK